MEKAKRQMKSKYVNNICLAVIVWHSQRRKMTHASRLRRRDNQKNIKKHLSIWIINVNLFPF